MHNLSSELNAAEVAAYGRVIRMMAHEVNNATASTRTLLDALTDAAADRTLDDGELRGLLAEYLPVVRSRGDDVNEFMRRFAEVVRLPEPQLAPLDLVGLLREQAAAFAPSCAQDGIALHVDLPAGPVEVMADRALLGQVIANALVNARDSLVGEEGDAPRLRVGATPTIEVRVVERPRGFTVADNGPGIDAAVADDLFTPFTSTKATGQGIGLTVTRHVLDGHGARYTLVTEEDNWTRLRVEFGDL